MTGAPPVDEPARLDALLELLCPEPASERGAAYERVHTKLQDIFRWRGLPDPEALADETLDRVARKAAEGLELDKTPTAYVLGVARLVALEAGRRAQREVRAVAPERFAAAEPDREVERRARALDACLERLDAEDRGLLLEYHRGDGRARIDGRQSLAERLGTNLVALRVRAFRLRAKMERCVKKQLGGDMDPAPTTRRVR